MENIWVYIYVTILFIVSIALMQILLPKFIRFLKRKGKIGIDVHKLDKPEVAEMGGVVILIVAIAVPLIPLLLFDDFIVKIQIIVFMAVLALIGLIGIIDDLYGLGAKMKPLLVTVSSFPLLIANFIWYNQIFSPVPWFPLIGGGFRITILYWILVPLALTIAANAINMMDVVNGSMSGPCIVVFGTLLICSLVKIIAPVALAPEMKAQGTIGALLSAIMLGIVVIFYKYNRFPAKIFSGDVGAFTLGGAIALIGIMGGLEVVTVIVAIPFIINAFQMLASVRGFVEGRKIKERPSIVQSNGTIAANTDIRAPITLMRIVMAKGPLKEPEIARHFLVLTLFSAFLAIITMILTYYLYLPL